MFETMRSVNGAGLAAPQIGVDLQLVIFGFNRNERYPDAPPVPETVLLNPVIEPIGDAVEEGWEGCLSVPGMRGVVPRLARIRYRGVDVDGRPIEREADGFHARVVQHECDHLVGMLYPMRDPRFQPLRLHQRAVPRARRRRGRLNHSGLVAAVRRRASAGACKGTCRPAGRSAIVAGQALKGESRYRAGPDARSRRSNMQNSSNRARALPAPDVRTSQRALDRRPHGAAGLCGSAVGARPVGRRPAEPGRSPQRGRAARSGSTAADSDEWVDGRPQPAAHDRRPHRHRQRRARRDHPRHDDAAPRCRDRARDRPPRRQPLQRAPARRQRRGAAAQFAVAGRIRDGHRRRAFSRPDRRPLSLRSLRADQRRHRRQRPGDLRSAQHRAAGDDRPARAVLDRRRRRAAVRDGAAAARCVRELERRPRSRRGSAGDGARATSRPR